MQPPGFRVKTPHVCGGSYDHSCGLTQTVRQAKLRHQSFLGRPGATTTAVSRDNDKVPPSHPLQRLPACVCVCVSPPPSEMPTGVSQQRNKRAGTTNGPDKNGINNDLTPEHHSLSQLQQAIEQEAGSSTGNPLQNPRFTPGQAIDGARNPIAPGAEYTSLRRITRRLPDDPEHVLDGVDTTHADLSWTAREDGDDINPSTGEPWLFPKKRGRKVGSNLVDFKDEIEERTKNGQGCKAISEALVAKGVDTSSRAVARQRMKWGLRQRVSSQFQTDSHLRQ